MKEVTAAIILKNNKVLIAQRAPDDKLAGKWEFPGGKIEPGETPQECLKREIREELDESSKILAEYLTRILREIFDYIDDGDTIVSDRVNLCNGILLYIIESIQNGSFSFKKDEVLLKRVKLYTVKNEKVG
ncbi:MAG: (deoxy)nucleoside triphosphate pyrophosphohydrolase [Desulfitobacteriaceae bacterium]